MSGIAGILNLDGRPADPETLKRMGSALFHRGPDAEGYWTEGAVGLVHRMLATTPESVNETQPFLNETGELCLTFDGRIDNRTELTAELRLKGARLHSDTDAEIVLCAYQIYGEDCPGKIIGDFAFALWDRRNRLLFCARDPLGIRPFYYYADESRFLFASEMQPLFADTGVQRKPNLPLIGGYLNNHFDDQEATRYVNVHRLPPRYLLTMAKGGPVKRKYWDLEPRRAVRYRTDAEYAEHFRSVFQEAVRCRLRSKDPVGMMLSGGLDSSSIVCTAQLLRNRGDVHPAGLETFSKVFPDLPCDERGYIEAVIRECDLKANIFAYNPREPRGFDQAAAYPDLLYHPILLMNIPLFRGMQDRGVRVFLDGTGGDDLLAAEFSHLTDLLAQGRLLQLWKRLRTDSIAAEVPMKNLILNYCMVPFIPKAIRAPLGPIHRLLGGVRAYSCANSQFLRRVGPEKRQGIGPIEPRFSTRSQQQVYRGLYRGWNATVAGEAMDFLTSRFSLEVRYPFFDRRLVEFLIAIPIDQLWRGEQTKFVLRNAMKGVLPESVRTRRGKAEFSPVIDVELRRNHSAAVEELFRTSVMVSHGILDGAKLLKLLERYRRGAGPHLSTQVLFFASLELWFRSVTDS